MNEIQEPLKTILRDFCHVEWYEVDELAELVKNENPTFDVSALRNQINELIHSEKIPFAEINKITANEFRSTGEAQNWLFEISSLVFST